MRIGIELESLVKRNAGVNVESILTDFESTGDISIRGLGHGIEWKSRPFTIDRLPDILRQINNAKRYLTVNETCGLHIHIELTAGTDKLQKRTVKNLTKLFYNNQSIIMKLVNKTRERNRFCRTIKLDDIAGLIKQRSTYKLYKNIYRTVNIGDRQMKQSIKNHISGNANNNRIRKYGDRYKTLNLTPLLDINTVEFRLFQATLDTNKIEFYTRLVYRLAEKALKTQKVRLYKKNKYKTGDYRNNYKRLWEFLRSIDMIGDYKYAKSIMRGVTKPIEPEVM